MVDILIVKAVLFAALFALVAIIAVKRYGLAAIRPLILSLVEVIRLFR